ncbi:MAG: phosphatidate cytidylyltransferase [Epsilonproteobacteria bacterium]|nr:phosphatidate cytidylyltransferase [Campylobacterota bacterium]
MGFWERFKGSGPRFATGFGLLAVVGAVGWIDNFFLTWFFFGAVYLLAFKEAARLYGVDPSPLLPYAGAIWLAAYFLPDPDILFLAALIFASLKAYRPTVEPKTFRPFLYPTASFLFLLNLYTDYGMASLVWLLTVVALTDVGAWFVGKSIGRTPFSPTSPNKTLEGVFGGIAVATAAGTYVGGTLVDWPYALAVSLGVSVASIFGDLYESYLKRRAGVKDSGDILPGHGGVLDRVDGYLFGGVVMVLLLRGLL